MAKDRVGRAIRNAALLAAVGVTSAGVLYLRDIRPRDARRVEALEAKRLFRFGRDAVSSATLHTRGATVSFTREGSTFVLTEPVAWPAKMDAVTAFLDRVAAVALEPVLTEAATPTELSEWGLDRPLAVAHISLRGGERHTLHVAAKNPLVGKHPITDETKARVGLADPAFIWALDRPPEDFRENRLLAGVTPEDVTEIEVSPSRRSEFRLRRGDTAWTVEVEGKPVRGASASRIRLFLTAFTKRVTITRFISDDAAPPEVEAAPSRLRLTLEDGSYRTLLFLRSRETSAADGAWEAHFEGTRTRVEVDPSVELELKKDPDFFLDRTLSRLRAKDVARMLIQLGTEVPRTVVRTATEPAPAWAVEGDPSIALKSWRIDALIRRFSVMEAARIYEENPSPAQLREWLLDPPSRRFVFFDAEGTPLREVRVGHRFDESFLFVRSDRDPRVGLVPEAKLTVLPARFEELAVP